MATLHLSLCKSSPLIQTKSRTPPKILCSIATQNLSYWDSIHFDIHSHLTKSIPIREPTTVFHPMHHLTFAAPKTTASALCVAACELVGGTRQDAIVAASAIHLMHAAIYTHDHLLLTGSHPDPEIPHLFGPNIEMLTGDGIMPFAFEILAESAAGAGEDYCDKILKVIVEITEAVGAQAMGGDGVAGAGGRPERELHGCGAACGAILGGGSAEEVERLKRYGVYVGKVQGLLREKGESGGARMELVEKWRAMALKELEWFDGKKIEGISSIVAVGV